MTLGSPARRLPAAPRAAAVAAVAAFAVLAPVRMAQGLPKTRFAVVPAGTEGVARSAAAASSGPDVPPAPGPVVDSPFPLSHLGVRWTGSEAATVDIRLAGTDGVWGGWRRMAADHDLDNGPGAPILSELILGQGATHTQVRASGDARDVEIVAIDTIHGPRRQRVATAQPAKAASSTSLPSASSTTSTTSENGGDGADSGGRRSSDAASSSTTTTTKSSSTTTTTKSSSTTTTTGKAKPKAA
jgi:hypothetical protein